MKLEFMSLDLASLASTMAFIDAYKAKGYPLNVLICNAATAWAADGGYTGWFNKNGTANFPIHVDAKRASADAISSLEKNDTNISNFGSVVSFLGHIL